jgi:hypothetical protein
MDKALNAIGYQVIWSMGVLGAARGTPAWGIAAALLFVLVQWSLSRYRRNDLVLLVVSVTLGIAIDGAFNTSGWLHYASAQPALLAPAWVLAIWAAFALTVNHSLQFLQGRPLLAALLGAIGGPLAYIGAARLGAVTWAAPSVQLTLALAVAWGVAVPLLAEIARFTRPAMSTQSAENTR